ncbi:MAG: hypothetical protein JRN09_02080 [Nitrososphaerota archaeon]|nr:hypothetical protein [Nitrososphaerota archaeon]
MEKGEVGILAGQFGALIIAVLVLANFLGTSSALSNPTIGTVYWGGPSSQYQLTRDATNTETMNATTISVFYVLAPTTTPASVTVSRLCLDASRNDTGGIYNYNNVTFAYDSSSNRNYISFGPVGQQIGQTCTYTVILTDSLQQQASWIATVMIKG